VRYSGRDPSQPVLISTILSVDLSGLLYTEIWAKRHMILVTIRSIFFYLNPEPVLREKIEIIPMF